MNDKPQYHAGTAEPRLVYALEGEWDRLQAENERLRALLNDPKYIQMKADYNQGRLSWANMIEERERGLGLSNQ